MSLVQKSPLRCIDLVLQICQNTGDCAKLIVPCIHSVSGCSLPVVLELKALLIQAWNNKLVEVEEGMPISCLLVKKS